MKTTGFAAAFALAVSALSTVAQQPGGSTIGGTRWNCQYHYVTGAGTEGDGSEVLGFDSSGNVQEQDTGANQPIHSGTWSQNGATIQFTLTASSWQSEDLAANSETFQVTGSNTMTGSEQYWQNSFGERKLLMQSTDTCQRVAPPAAQQKACPSSANLVAGSAGRCVKVTEDYIHALTFENTCSEPLDATWCTRDSQSGGAFACQQARNWAPQHMLSSNGCYNCSYSYAVVAYLSTEHHVLPSAAEIERTSAAGSGGGACGNDQSTGRAQRYLWCWAASLITNRFFYSGVFANSRSQEELGTAFAQYVQQQYPSANNGAGECNAYSSASDAAFELNKSRTNSTDFDHAVVVDTSWQP